MPGPSNQPPRRDDSFARYAGLGMQYAATIAALALLGAWADKRLSSSPWLLLAGALVGFLAATFSLVRHVPPPGGKTGSRRGPRAP